jgi:hypothetical protein
MSCLMWAFILFNFLHTNLENFPATKKNFFFKVRLSENTHLHVWAEQVPWTYMKGARGAGQLLPSPPRSKAGVGSHVNCLGCYPELRSGTRLRATLSVQWLLE